MKERPILFSGAMVRAILSGQKTQTRRVVKHRWPHLWQEPWYATGCVLDDLPGQTGAFMEFRHRSQDESGYTGSPASTLVACPYGQPGDRLWVREAHSIHSAHGQHRDDGMRWGPWGGLPTQVSPDGTQICYYREGFDRCDPSRWRPSIHMPRWACRIVLEIVSVRVERLHLISRGDAMDEGCPFPNMAGEDDPRQWFLELWESINGPESCAANPWVWVVEFKRVAV